MKINKQDKLIILNLTFITSLLIANIVASKLVNIFGFIVPSAVVAYAFTFLCTDVIGELYGKEEANKTVVYGLIFQIMATLLIYGAIALPVADFMKDYQNIFKSVLSGSARITLASLVAYFIAQTNDVYIFHKLKEETQNKKKWLRNNLSTITSQFIDTAIFITIAFYGIVPNLFVVIYSQFFIKVILALIDTPFFYILTKNEDKG